MSKVGRHFENIRNSFCIYNDFKDRENAGEKILKWEIAWDAEGEGEKDIWTDEGKWQRNKYSQSFSRRMEKMQSLIKGAEDGRIPVTQWKGYNNELAAKKKTKAEFKPIKRSHRRRPRVCGS